MANDTYTTMNPGTGGDAMDESGVAYATDPLLRRRPRVVIAGDAAAGTLVDPLNANPAGGEWALPVRNIPSGTQTIAGTVVVSGAVAVTGPVDVPDRSARLLGVATLGTGAATVGKVDQGAAGVFAWKVDGSAATQPVSASALPLPAGASTETTLAQRLADVTFTGRINTQGQKAMTASTPVVLASDQSVIPADTTDRLGRLLGVLSAGANVIGRVGLDAANLAGIALDATVAAIRDRLPASLVGGRLDVNVGAATALDIADRNARAVGVVTVGAGSATIGKMDQGVGGISAWKTDGSATTQPVSASALPLPAGAAQDVTVTAVRDRLGIASVLPFGTEQGLIVRPIPDGVRRDTRMDLAGTNFNYVGYAPLGTATSAAAWTIKRITITASNPTLIQWTGEATAVWDNRATESYS